MKIRMSSRSLTLTISVSFAAIALLNVACYKAGTLGGGDLYQFDCTRETLQKCLDSMVLRNPSLTPPVKWMQYDNWSEKGYDFLDGVTFYYGRSDESDERMYYVTLIARGEQDTLWTKPSYLAVRSIFIENDKGVFWKTMEEVDEKEKELAEARIEILTAKCAQMCGCSRLEIKGE